MAPTATDENAPSARGTNRRFPAAHVPVGHARSDQSAELRRIAEGLAGDGDDGGNRPAPAASHVHRSGDGRPTSSSPMTSRGLFVVVLLAGLALRVAFSVSEPRNTQDLARGTVTGKAVWEHGIQAAGKPLLDTFPWATPANGVPWSHLPYNYPPVPVGFFTLIAALGGGTLLAKGLLGASDALCAWLIARVTGRKVYGLLYWVSPVAMWWTSHEGQFESIQSAFSLGALATLQWPVACGVLIALAVQTKLTAAALLPFLAWTMYRKRRLRSFIAGGCIGTLPTVALSFVYPVVANIFRYSMQFRWNPYYWNPASRTQFWSSYWVVGRVIPQVLSWLFIGWLLVVCRRRDLIPRAGAAIAFALFMKLYGQIPPWYLVTLPVLLVPLAMPDPDDGRLPGPVPTLGFRIAWIVALAAETPTILYMLQAMFS